MKRVFVDTSALVALFDRKDKNHQRAKAVLERIRASKTEMVITDYIFDECITTVLFAKGHQTAVAIGEFILSSKILKMIWLNDNIKLNAWAYFKKHSDKTFSFTDCTSFVFMKEMHIVRYFSFDSDFRQAGFSEYY